MAITGKKNSEFRFTNQVIFITGGTSGIGLATAVDFAKTETAKIIVCGRILSKWEKAQDYIRSHLTSEQAKKIAYWACDVRVEQQVKDTIEKIYEQFGRLDVAFNNAGVSPGVGSAGTDLNNMDFVSSIATDGSLNYSLLSPQPNSDFSEDDSWQLNDPTQASGNSPFRENPIATTVFGTFYSLKWEIEYAFKHQPKDLPVAIINTVSRNGIIPDPNRPLYAASKAFIVNLTQSLSNQVAQRSIKEKRSMIRINAIAPGPVDTPMERSAFSGADFEAKAAVGVPMQRIAQPEEISPAVLFLADHDQASYITGAVLPIDGGDTASPYIPPK